MYKDNPTHQNDELIDEIPVLIDRNNKKARNKRSSSGQRDEGYAQKRELGASDAFRKDGQHDDEHGHDGVQGNSQVVKKKDNQIIVKNILNVKHKKILSLSRKGNSSSRDWKATNKSQSTQANTTLNLEPLSK